MAYLLLIYGKLHYRKLQIRKLWITFLADFLSGIRFLETFCDFEGDDFCDYKNLTTK